MSGAGPLFFLLAITLGCLVRDVEVSVYGTRHAGSSLAGHRTTCTNEGEEVKIDGEVKDVSCFKCICNNGYVECVHEPCLSQGCYLMMGRERDGCCRKCKGCVHNGKVFSHNDEWADPHDPCKVYSCVAGIVTQSELQCYTPCRQPSPPLHGQCCPTCPGCQFNGLLMEDRDVTIPEDPCLTCQCTQGRMTCSKKACPVLQCDKSKAVRPPGQCCPNCPGSRYWMDPPKGNCILGKEIHKTGQMTHRVDDCARCECFNGTSLCRRETCPVLECGIERQQTHPGECCPRCPIEKPVRSYCFDDRERYEEGVSWKRDACTSCVCNNGHVRCAISKCPHLAPCKHNQRLQHRPGDCCARCVENDGVCTVFGDPHYRTFDGKLFSFQGPCKYQLTADCVDKTFSIRVTNDARQTKTSAWTKTVSIKMGDVKVNLGQRLRVKVNGQRVEVPYALRGQLQVNRTEDGVYVTTRLGINVLWDGNSFVEVTAPPSYKGKLCGLCGNYNSVSRDDMTLRNGRLATSADKFGASWRVGVRRACSRSPRPDLALPPGRDPICPHSHRRLLDNRRCKPLKGEPFAACHHKLSLNIYFRSCQMDMCECPNGLCYCESFFAYARECARLGVDLGDWREATGCLGPWQKASQRPGHSSRTPST